MVEKESKRGRALVQDRVRELLRTMSRAERGFAPRSCKVSEAVEPLFGRPYRVVEWSVPREGDARRRVVPADSSAMEIVSLVMSHVPGRRFSLAFDDSDLGGEALGLPVAHAG
jgi:hypothetical protein